MPLNPEERSNHLLPCVLGRIISSISLSLLQDCHVCDRLAKLLRHLQPIRVPHSKNRFLIAIAKPACNSTTPTTMTRLVLFSTILTTGQRLRTKKPPLTARPTPTKTQFRAVIGLQLINATGIQMMFEYPYSAQHSTRIMRSPAVVDEEAPYHLSRPHKITGTMRVYPYTNPAAPLNSLKS